MVGVRNPLGLSKVLGVKIDKVVFILEPLKPTSERLVSLVPFKVVETLAISVKPLILELMRLSFSALGCCRSTIV